MQLITAVNWARVWIAVLIGNFAVLAVAIALMMTFPQALGMAARPPQEFACDTGTVQPNPAWTFVRCGAQPYTNMVPADAAWSYPSGWVVQTTQSKPAAVRVKLDGWGHFPEGGINANFAEPDTITIKTVYAHYPLDQWTDARGNVPMDWGGPFRGVNSNGNRLDATISAIAARGYRVDWGAGITFTANCYGAAGALAQALILPSWQPFISGLNLTLPGMIASAPNGKYWRNQTAWAPYDVSLAQPEKHLDKLKHIYISMRAGSYPADEIGFDQRFLPDVCDAGRIACRAVWGDQGHAWPDPKSPPHFQAISNQYYDSPDMIWRLDAMKVIFTESSANHFGPRGHYNLGLRYNAKSSQWLDSTSTMRVPLGYLRTTNMGIGLPDQLPVVTVKVTLRPIKHRLTRNQRVYWTFGPDSGSAVVEHDGEVTIPVTMTSSNGYTALEVTP